MPAASAGVEDFNSVHRPMLKELPMQTTLQSPLDAVINWSIPGQLVDQFPAAVVVVNWCPPLGGH
jgi:hypothetical protein